MESISGWFFIGFYVFSIISICWWVYLFHAHDGVGVYAYLAEQKSSFSFDLSLGAAARKHLELISILISFVIFLYALCRGFAYYFSWIPETFHLTLGDGSVLHLSTILSCLFGICSAIVFGRWVFTGICAFWEKRALAEQAMIYFDIICQADSIEALLALKKQTLDAIQCLNQQTFTPGIVSSRLALCVRVIELRIRDIQAKQAVRP